MVELVNKTFFVHCKAFLTTDATVIVNTTLMIFSDCTVAGPIHSKIVPALVFFINIPTMTLARLCSLSPSCVISHHCRQHSIVFWWKTGVETLDGYIFPLSIILGLQHMDMYTPTPTDLVTNSYAFLSSDMDWISQNIVHEYTV
jgi:hypothetical protein